MSLVETAIAGAKRAGMPIVAVDVHGGGFVRIFSIDPTNLGKLTEVNTCDDIFKAESS
jgi:hypothetical protein